MVRDIVCGMGVEENDPDTCVKSFRGTVLYFCSPQCMMLFTADPDDYLVPRAGRPATARDLVCGMEVDTENAPAAAQYQGMSYYFCCNSCRREFTDSPEKFIHQKDQDTRTAHNQA